MMRRDNAAASSRAGFLSARAKSQVMAVLLACFGFSWSVAAAADFSKATEHFRKGEYAQALRELQPLVDAGDPEALNAMGVLFKGGHGVAKDLRVAAEYYRKSATKGSAAGQYNLAVLLRDGAGVTKDERQAVEWFRRAADQGDADAQRELGYMFANGAGGLAKDQVQAVAWLRKAADQGDAAAQFSLGWSFAYGVGSPKDQATAAKWLQKSADQDYAAAQRELGVLVFNGTGVKQDQQQGIKWLRNAADKGDLTAQMNLGRIYRQGLGTSKDDTESTRWYRKAAEQGDASSQRELGIAYGFGYGVGVDEREAARWYRKAADQGDAAASNNLGNLHELGEGGQRQDYVEAVRLYEAAARQGEPYAQRNLARMYREGLGVRSDAVVACAWANLAASAHSPHPKAADERSDMTQYMPKELLDEGQRLAREWTPGKPLGKSRLKPVAVSLLKENLAAKVAADIGALAKALEANQAQEGANQFPARPVAKPGLVTCNTRCTNGDCYRTYGDGRKVRFQARQKWNPINNQFEWDSGGC